MSLGELAVTSSISVFSVRCRKMVRFRLVDFLLFTDALITACVEESWNCRMICGGREEEDLERNVFGIFQVLQ